MKAEIDERASEQASELVEIGGNVFWPSPSLHPHLQRDPGTETVWLAK